MIVVVDVGLGNLRSVVRALVEAGAPEADVCISGDPDVVAGASRLVAPGQGAFGDCASAFARDGGALGSALTTALRRGVPYLGICLGLQVLFASSEEAPECAGLNWFAGRVVRFPADAMDPETGTRLKVPHVGWNVVDPCGDGVSRLGPPAHYYFVHSYFVVPEDPSLAAAHTMHGAPFVSAVARENVLAVQFHPEKSQAAGLGLLRAWLDATRRA